MVFAGSEAVMDLRPSAPGPFERRDESAHHNGTLGLVLGLPEVVAMGRGILIEIENTFFRQVQDDLGSSSPWSRLHRIGVGFVASCAPALRASAALHLYSETRRVLSPLLDEAGSAVIEAACRWVADAPVIRQDKILAHDA